MKRTGPTNVLTRMLVRQLRKTAREKGARVWLKVAEELEKPRRRRVAVNLSRINRSSREGEMVIVPGVVLGVGDVNKKLTVVAVRITRRALEKLKASNCQFMTIAEALKVNPEGSNVRVIV